MELVAISQPAAHQDAADRRQWVEAVSGEIVHRRVNRRREQQHRPVGEFAVLGEKPSRGSRDTGDQLVDIDTGRMDGLAGGPVEALDVRAVEHRAGG